MATAATLPPPYTVAPLDPQQAQQLAEQGAAILLLDVPMGSLIGVDHQVLHCCVPECHKKTSVHDARHALPAVISNDAQYAAMC